MDDLIRNLIGNKLDDFRSQVAQNLTNAGNAIGGAVQNIANFRVSPNTPTLGQSVQQTFSTPNWFYPTALVNGSASTGIPQIRPLEQSVGRIGQQVISQPIQQINQGINQIRQPGLENKFSGALNLASGGFGVTPFGSSFNAVMGAGSELRKATGQNNPQTEAFVNTVLPFMAGGVKTEEPAFKDAVAMYRNAAPNIRNNIRQIRDILGSEKGNMGTFGEEVQSVIDTMTNKQLSHLSNKQISNFLDAVVQQADKMGNYPKTANIGLSVKNIRNGAISNTEEGQFPAIKGNKAGGEQLPLPELPNQPESSGPLNKSSLPNLNQNPYINANGEPLPWENPAYVKQQGPQVPPLSVAQKSGDIAMIENAQRGGGIGSFFNGVKNLPNEVASSFRDWVNSRHALDIQGQIAKKPFQELDPQGLDAIKQIQEGKTGGIFDQVRGYFNNKFDQLNKEGINLGYKQDYLPQLWNNSPEQIQQALGKTLTTKPSFSLQSLFKTYQDGIDAGLTPRFTKLSDLVGWYESYANKAIVDKQFFGQLLHDGNLMPSSKAPQGWVTIDPDRFPKYLTRLSEGGEYVGTYKAPKPIADVINNYLRPGAPLGEAIAKFTSKAKNIALSSGIPNTGINAHGFNTLVRTLAFNNPVSGLLRGAAYMVNPNAADRYVQVNLPTAEKFIKAGMSFSTEDHAFTQAARVTEGNVFKNIFNKGLNLQESLFEKPLFQKILPAHKIAFAQESYNDLIKSGVPEDQAVRQAAQEANHLFGGINTDEIGRSKDLQNVLRSIVLAPDWAESNVSLGKNIVKGVANFTDPKYATYRNLAGGLMGSYVAANLTNKALSGHWMWQNEPGNEVNIDTGSYTPEGQKRYIRVFGTAADFARIPYELALGTAKGDLSGVQRTLQARLSVPASAISSFIANKDYSGNPITGKDKYGRPLSVTQQIGGLAGLGAQFVGLPQPVQAAIQVGSGRQSPEQGLTSALELPLRYSGGTFSPSDKLIAGALNVTGKDRYDLSQTLKNQPNFSKNQLDYIQQNGMQGLKDLIDIRNQKKQLNQPANTDNSVAPVQAAGNTGKTNIKNQIALQKFKNSDQQDTTIGGNYYYKDDSGNVKNVPLNRPTSLPLMTGNPVYDMQLLSRAGSAITARQNDIVTLAEHGQIPQDQAVQQINQLYEQKQAISQLSSQLSKYSKSQAGGQTGIPGNSTSGGRIGRIRMPTLRGAKPRLPRVKSTRQKPIKLKSIKAPAKIKLTQPVKG